MDIEKFKDELRAATASSTDGANNVADQSTARAPYLIALVMQLFSSVGHIHSMYEIAMNEQEFKRRIVDLVFANVYQAVLLCLPAFIMELLHNELHKVKSLLITRQADLTEGAVGAATLRALRYMQQRPLRLRLARVLAVDSSLPVAFLSLLFTYSVLVLQLHKIL
ncbi:uncharacterized protein LOC125228643 [Leguminivora glycinivorella]|uniref:uncharacterized protein LOC125228643 n=1 Tax=Leguminivora glycinivorella TaxID=1035111 RepID=UPI00200CE4EA|nr:uncharacterized protein LOC125228643 [Leguminivora glycinivorella]